MRLFKILSRDSRRDIGDLICIFLLILAGAMGGVVFVSLVANMPWSHISGTT
jgi:hypothetical protein